MKKWFLNLFLAAAVLFLGSRIYAIWSRPDPLPPAAAESRSRAAFPVSPPAAAHRLQPSTYYSEIAAKNLFSSDRGRTVETGSVVDAKAVEESRFAKNIALYGIVWREDRRSALVSMGSSPRAGAEYSWVQVGEKLGQVAVIGIEKDRIHVREGASTFEIRLDDRTHPSKKASVQRSQAPTVVTSKAAAPEPRRPPPPMPQQPVPQGAPAPPTAGPPNAGQATEK